MRRNGPTRDNGPSETFVRARSRPQKIQKCLAVANVHRTLHAAELSPAPVVNWGSLSALVFFRSQATAAKYALPIKAA